MLETLAPHLVRPTPFLFPLTITSGSGLYRRRAVPLRHAGRAPAALPRHRHLSRAACLRAFPVAARRRARRRHPVLGRPGRRRALRLALVRTAPRLRRLRTSAVGAEGFASTAPASPASACADLETGDDLDVRGRRSSTRRASGPTGPEPRRPRPHPRRASKGIHLVVPRDRIHGDSGLILRTEKSVLFVIPWESHWIIGTTDTDWNLDLAHPAASRARHRLSAREGEHACSPSRCATRTSKASTRDCVRCSAATTATQPSSPASTPSASAPGLITVAGGKYTTYRVMAKDVVDVAAPGAAVRACPQPHRDTAAARRRGAARPRVRLRRAPRAPGTGAEQLQHLLGATGRSRTSCWTWSLEEPVAGGAARAARRSTSRRRSGTPPLHEAALHVDDVLTRRTHIAFEVADRGKRPSTTSPG